MLMNRAYIEVGIVFVDHLMLKVVPEGRFPTVSILSLPTTVGLSHLPIRAGHVMGRAIWIGTPELVVEVVGDLL